MNFFNFFIITCTIIGAVTSHSINENFNLIQLNFSQNINTMVETGVGTTVGFLLGIIIQKIYLFIKLNIKQ